MTPLPGGPSPPVHPLSRACTYYKCGVFLAVGVQARLMSQALRKLTANASKCNCTILFLNQLRHKVGVVYGNPEVTSGGQALKFYASVRLEVRRKQTVEDAAGVGIGIKVKAKVSTTALLLQGSCQASCILSTTVLLLEGQLPGHFAQSVAN